MPTYFQVPFPDKDAAKAMGARWDAHYELWCAPDSHPDVAEAMAKRWRTTQPLEPIDTFPGEDRAFGDAVALAIDLIPSTCWFTNVRSCVPREDWKRIAMGVKRRANRTCELCGVAENPKAGILLEAHERFAYENRAGVPTQVLKRLVSACSRCHLGLHYGHAQATGQEDDARAQLAAVNQWDDDAIDKHVVASFAQWSARSRLDWVLDIAIIEQAGVTVRLPTPQQRRAKGVDLSTLPSLDDMLKRHGAVSAAH